jgi:acetate---CoA ligase (ADP-forming)
VHGAVRLRERRRDMLPPATPDLTALRALDLRAGDEVAAKAVLAAAGVPVLPERLCASAADAVAAAEAMGFPVAAKVVSPDIAHKTEVGGVALDLADAAAVERAYAAILDRVRAARPDAALRGVLVSPMRRGGVETIIGVQRDPVFGPMVMFGLGGVLVELFGDVAFASAPLGAEGARRLVDAVRGRALLAGWRGAAPADLAALAEAVRRVSELAAAQADRLDAIEINPFLVGPDGGVALDALLAVRPARNAAGGRGPC